MYRIFSHIYPKNVKKKFVDLLLYAGIKTPAERYMGAMVVFGFLISVTLALYGSLLFKISWPVMFAGCFLLSQGSVYFTLVLKADSKGKFVEEILPDVLQLMASNLRAGFTSDRALVLAARPEFGPFQDEINRIGKEIATGKSVAKALDSMKNRIRSDRLSKSITLIVSGLKSGGELASLLEQTARNLRQETIVDSRIRANVMMYVIFIAVAVCMGAPMLFGLSSFLVEVLTTKLSQIDIPESAASQMPLSFGTVSIDPAFVISFALVFLVTSGFFGSLILGLISKGREREGLKYAPFLIGASILIFFVARLLIKGLLGGIFEL